MKTIIYISKEDARKLFIFLVIIEIILACCYIITEIYHIPYKALRNLFNLDGEYGLPALFSFCQLFVISLFFIYIANLHSLKEKLFKLFFYSIGFGFMFLSFDEFFTIHEHIDNLIKHFSNGNAPHLGSDYSYWIIPYIILTFIFFLITHKVLFRIYKTYKSNIKLIVLGFIILFGGAIGIESIGHLFIMNNTNLPEWVYTTEVIIEEFLEMIGATIILYSTLQLRNEIKQRS